MGPIFGTRILFQQNYINVCVCVCNHCISEKVSQVATKENSSEKELLKGELWLT